MQKLEEHEQKLNALTQINHAYAIKELVQANIIQEVKNQLPKFVPKAVSDYVEPHLASTVKEALKTTHMAQTDVPTSREFTKFDLKEMLYEKIFQNDMDQLSHLRRNKFTMMDPPGNHEGENKKRRQKDTSRPYSKKGKMILLILKDLKMLMNQDRNKSKNMNPSIYNCNRNAELGIHHWRDDHQWFYKGSIGHKSAHDVYLKIKIISAKRITAEKKYEYDTWKEIVVKRADKKEYMFSEADFPRLN
ncbi:hypothetical protein Tco_0809523 [Tanacetum coccineum]